MQLHYYLEPMRYVALLIAISGTVWAAEPAPAKKRPAHTAESFVIGGQRRAADHDGNVHTAPSWRLT